MERARKDNKNYFGNLKYLKISGRSYTIRMRSLKIHWKTLILPAGAVGVSIWTCYVGFVALFQQSDKQTQGSVSKSSARHHGLSRTNPQYLAVDDDQTRSSLRTHGLRQEVEGLEANQSAKEDPDKANSSELARGDGESVMAEVEKSQSSTSLSKAGAILREQIISEAVDRAIRSEKPWENLIAVSKELSRLGKSDDARNLLLRAEKMAIDPDDDLGTSYAIRAVVKAMLLQQHSADANNALQNIQNLRERERAIAEVAAWSARHGEVDTARQMISQVLEAADRDVALIAIAESEASYEGTAIAMQTASLIASERKKDEAHQKIAMKRAGLRDFAGAENALGLIRSHQLKESALMTLARLRVRAGDLTGSLQTMQNITERDMLDVSLREVAGELAKLGDFSRSSHVATRIHSPQERSYALEDLSVAQARVGDLSGSLVRTDSIPVDSIRYRTLREVSGVTAYNGSPDRARNVAIKIESGVERDRAYRTIAQAAVTQGDYVAAYNTLQDINQVEQKALALVSMARTRQKQGDARHALALLEDASRVARGVTSLSLSDQIQSDMAAAYAERSDAAHSLLIADNIRNPRRRDHTYGYLARTLAGSDIHAAQQSILSISSNEIRISAEDAVARNLAKNVAPQIAVKKARVLNSERQRVIFLLEMSRKT